MIARAFIVKPPAALARLKPGRQLFWAIMLILDQAGPWSASDIARYPRVDYNAARAYLARLIKAGKAEFVDTRPSASATSKPAKLHRLLERPAVAPDLDENGIERPEPQIEIIWRTARIAKSFTAMDIVELASTAERPLEVATVSKYLGSIAREGVLVCTGSKQRQRSYVLVMNLGPLAPRVRPSGEVFDPNSGGLVFRSTP